MKKKVCTHPPGEHSECIRITFFRDLDGRFSGLWGSHKFRGTATVDARDIRIRPQVLAGDHEAGTKACYARGSIGADQGVLL